MTRPHLAWTMRTSLRTIVSPRRSADRRRRGLLAAVRATVLVPVLWPVLSALLIAGAPVQAADLAEALARAEDRTGVVTGALELEDARRRLESTEADPSTLRLDRLQAEHALELADAALRTARYRAYAEIAAAYLRVLEASSGRDFAEDGAGLSERAVDIATIRLERGAGTQLDLRDAETDLASALNDLAAAGQGLALAKRSFESLTGLPGEGLAPVPDGLLATEVPDEALLAARLADSPTLLRASHGVELARAALDLLDPAYAPARDIESAELAHARAGEGLAEARRGVELQLRTLLNRVEAARDAASVAHDALANARERDAIERARLDAGLIAEIAYDQTRLATRRAELAAMQADHEVLLALFDLQAGAGVAIEGLDAF